MTTIALLLSLWTCTAHNNHGVLFTGEGLTKRVAEKAAMNACRHHHPGFFCHITGCVLKP